MLGLEPGWQTYSYPCTFEWQKLRFPDPAAFCGNLLKKGIRLNLWENPYISPEAKLYKPMYPLLRIAYCLAWHCARTTPCPKPAGSWPSSTSASTSPSA